MQLGQRKLYRDQEDHIEEIHSLTVRMKQAGQDINDQLQRQQGLIHELDEEMDFTTGKLQGLNAEIGELLETKDINQVCTCLMLCCLMILLIVLIIIF